MAPRSKRQRKQKDRLSLKGKHGGSTLNYDDQRDNDDEVFDPNAVILPSQPEPHPGVSLGAHPQPAAQRLSKSQQRKQRKALEAKQQRARRAEVLASLAKHQLDVNELGLLRPVSTRGQKESKRDALRRALQLQRAGVELPDTAQLFKERRSATQMLELERESDSDSDDGDEAQQDSEDQGRAAMLGQTASNPGNLVHKVHKPGSVGEKRKVDGKYAVDDAGAAKRQRAPFSGSYVDDGSGVLIWELEGQIGSETKAAQMRELKRAAAEAKQEILANGDASLEEDENDELGGGIAATVKPRLASGKTGKSRVVLVQRPESIEAVRSELPIIAMEQEIMEAVAENDVLVLCGATGCGKTTQVPQFLYEAGYGSALFDERCGAIGITQPRRVAAVSTATRVAEELGTKLGDVVGYQVRYDRRVGSATALKFMTDGVLLREVQEDFLLRKYSALIVDEAHERSLNTDILLGMLSRIVSLRRSMSSSPLSPGQTPVHPLKLIVMSATLRTEDFLENRRLFPVRPPLVSVPSRQFPVTVHFSRRTELHDYIGAAYKKVCQIHKNLPPGGVLVFLTGQREVEHLCQKLRKGLQSRKPTASTKQQQSSSCRESKSTGSGVDGTGDAPWPLNDQENGALGCLEGADEGETDAAAAADEAMLLEALAEDRNAGGEGYPDDFELQEDDDDNVDEEEEEDDVVVLGGEGFTPEQMAEAEKLFDQRLAAAFASSNTATSAASSDTKGLKTKTDDEDGDKHTPPVHVLPLYAMLSPSQQARVFAPPPPGSRLIVVATNVAETSLTIPGIRYVVDAGRSKQRLIESAAGLARFEVRWISQASAEQRAGRAGRTGPGHCYRLFSSAVFNDTFPRHSPPEIANAALEGVALVLKSLGVDKVVNFPFPTPPEATALSAAEKCLVALAALDPSTGRLTAMGKDMATFPISPRHARMLLEVVRDYATSPGGNNGLNDAVSAVSNANATTSTEKRRKDAVSKQPSVTKAELLSYAVALAAALSVESPFINVEIAGFGGEDATETGRKSGRSEHDREKGESDGAEQGPASGKAAVAQRTTAMEAAAKEEQKRKRQEARQAHARLRVHDSDALSALCALCAFEAAGQSESFCRANHLHFRNLREASALRKQLARIVASQTATMPSLQTAAAAAEKATLAATLQQTPASPPPLAALQALRKALTAGWADHVARRVRSLDYVMRQRPQSGEESQYTRTHKGRAVRYLSCAMDDEEVFLHPNSALYTAAPEFVVYSELVRTSKRPYMAGVTAVEASWLPRSAAAMCDFSEPLANPPPFYNPSVDAVMCWRDATFGRHCWPLPRTTGEHSNATERAAAFADAFLSGEVVKSASELKSMLAVQPLLATRPETRVQRRAADLIAVLVSNKVDSKRALAAKWRKDPGFLKREMLSWVQKGGAARFEAMWPKMVAEAFASPGRKSAVP